MLAGQVPDPYRAVARDGELAGVPGALVPAGPLVSSGVLVPAGVP